MLTCWNTKTQQESLSRKSKRAKNKEIKQFEKIMKRETTFKVTLSQDLILLRNRIEKLISIGKYEEADILKDKAEELEKVEYTKAAIESELDIDKDKERLIAAHQKTIEAMLRRIERDRREQTRHRKDDTQRLVQRNKNLLKDIDTRQAQEKRKTKQFLTWALSDIHTFKNLKSKIAQSQSGKARNFRGPKPKSIPKTRARRMNIMNNKYSTLMKNRNSLPMVNKSRESRSEVKIHRKKNIQSNLPGSLLHVMKHKAGIKLPKKSLHNMSYNDAYGVLEDIESSANYSSVM
ncbi:unnamed protein product [Moneuplotes crassus]|uniref:Uncharacterized protein n=1 Tax=Euplotes crassus TaxID=5936 RepID=A0AAD2DBA8_EUPCR|nr:unnamed protein product [Moneuplotes crassus]